MKFKSTRGKSKELNFSQVVEEGLATDGGLYVPESFPDITDKFEAWQGLDYPSLCFEFFKLFTDEIPQEELKEIVFKSYEKFDSAEIAPMKKLKDNLYVLELFHGPTLAFKDFALQLLGNLYEYLLAKSGKAMNVLGATSGDTGSAAISALLGKKGVNIFMLYPNGRISPLQERQMTCTKAENVFPIAISGTFDDAQAMVKSLFSDVDFKNTWDLRAINSINMARILAQCVYYIFAYLQVEKSQRENIEFIVPTGNFGNVLAGWFASKMGMKVKGFKVATNQNDILFRLFDTGVYKLDDVNPSYAPSMDIQIASNFERFIYYMENGNTEKVCEIMEYFSKNAIWEFESFDKSNFTASRMTDEQIPSVIAEIYKKYDYIIDPHTACAFADINEESLSIVLSTASPAKFPELIIDTINVEPKADSLEKLKSETVVNTKMKVDLDDLREYINLRGLKNEQ